jgi:hypothetical protein
MRRGKAVLAVAAAMVGGARRGALAVPGSTERCAGCEPKTGWEAVAMGNQVRRRCGEIRAAREGGRERERSGKKQRQGLKTRQGKARQERERREEKRGDSGLRTQERENKVM